MRTKAEQLMELKRLETRAHPRCGSKVQYRYLDNAGHWRWGPQSARKAPYRECMVCGVDKAFVQELNGWVRGLCTNCEDAWVEWTPASAYETRQDGGAAWRRAIRAASAI